MNPIKQTTTVALLEPDPDYARMWESFLKNIYLHVAVRNLNTANDLHDLLALEDPDLILFEYDLPDTRGTYLLSELADDYGMINIPTVMTSGKCPDAVLIDAYRRGLHSYVNKNGVTAEILRSSISIATRKVNRMAEIGDHDSIHLCKYERLPVKNDHYK